MLEASLYKYKNLQSRSEEGKLNSIISNKSFVIGAYQNVWFNYVLILIFVLTMIGICIHIIARKVNK